MTQAPSAYVTMWFVAFVATQAFEAPVAFPFLRAGEASVGRRLAAIALVNLASHPAVWFVFPELGLSPTLTLLLSEGWAVLIETLGFRLILPRLRWSRALATAALANAASVAAGWALRSLGVPL